MQDLQPWLQIPVESTSKFFDTSVIPRYLVRYGGIFWGMNATRVAQIVAKILHGTSRKVANFCNSNDSYMLCRGLSRSHTTPNANTNQRCHQYVDHSHDNNDASTNQRKHDGRTKVSWRASASDVSCEDHQYGKGSLQSQTTTFIVGCAPKTICRFQFPCLNARLEDTAMSNEVRLKTLPSDPICCISCNVGWSKNVHEHRARPSPINS